MTPVEITWDSGLRLIAAERNRQVEEEGWTPEHDDTHDEGELASAAAVYALPMDEYTNEDDRMLIWPWEYAWYKPTPDDRLGELVKAGALIAAEIDRLLRVEARSACRIAEAQRKLFSPWKQAEGLLRAKAGATTDPAYGRRLSKFLRLVDWARS